MPRSVLPQNYIIDNGSIMEDFESLGSWVNFGSGTVETDTVIFYTGTQSIKLSVTTPGSWVLSRNGTYSPAKDLRSNKNTHLWFYCHDNNPAATISTLVITLSSVTNNSKYFTWSIGGSEMRSGWNHYVIDRNAWTVIGETWEAIIRIAVKINALSGQTPSISIDSLGINIEQIPSVVLAFDDSRTSVMDGYNYMTTKNLKGTVYVIPTVIDTDGYLTSANLATLYAAGWALTNHTYNHWANPFLVGHTQAEIESELTQCQAWLDAREYMRASKFVAYPGGGYDDNVLAAMSSAGMLTGRMTSALIQNAPVDNQYLLRSKDIGNDSVSLAEAKSYIDQGITRQGAGIIHFHQLGDVADVGTWTNANFQSLVDYIIARRVNVLTIDEWYEGLTNPRYTSGPLVRASR